MIRRLIILLLIVGCGFAKEENIITSKPDVLKNNKSIGIGIFTNKSPNIIEYTYNFKISKKISIYPLIGLPLYPLGLGLSWQQHYNQNGIALNLTLGFGSLLDSAIENWSSVSIFYQWEIANSSLFTSLGIRHHIISENSQKFIKCGDEDGINGCLSGTKEVPLTDIYGIILPIISIEKRF